MKAEERARGALNDWIVEGVGPTILTGGPAATVSVERLTEIIAQAIRKAEAEAVAWEQDRCAEIVRGKRDAKGRMFISLTAETQLSLILEQIVRAIRAGSTPSPA